MVLRRIASFGRRSKRSPRNNAHANAAATPAQNINWLEIARSGAGETVNVNCRRSALGEFGVHLDLVQGSENGMSRCPQYGPTPQARTSGRSSRACRPSSSSCRSSTRLFRVGASSSVWRASSGTPTWRRKSARSQTCCSTSAAQSTFTVVPVLHSRGALQIFKQASPNFDLCALASAALRRRA